MLQNRLWPLIGIWSSSEKKNQITDRNMPLGGDKHLNSRLIRPSFRLTQCIYTLLLVQIRCTISSGSVWKVTDSDTEIIVYYCFYYRLGVVLLQTKMRIPFIKCRSLYWRVNVLVRTSAKPCVHNEKITERRVIGGGCSRRPSSPSCSSDLTEQRNSSPFW